MQYYLSTSKCAFHHGPYNNSNNNSKIINNSQRTLRFFVFAILASFILSRAEGVTFSSTSFIAPAAPPIHVSADATSWFTSKKAGAAGATPTYVATPPERVSPTVLHAKKQSNSGSTSTAPSTKKIQVKLLKHVPGTGHAGQVIMVTPAFFQNKLRPTKSAEIITDEQLQREQAAAAAAEQERMKKATELKEIIASTQLMLARKAGPDGHLFGGIGPKVIMEELVQKIGEQDFLTSKSVKITALLDAEGQEMRGDIKHTGNFSATITLAPSVSAKLSIVVVGAAT